MSILSSYAPIIEAGNNSKVDFDFTFKIFNASELVVNKILIATGVKTLMTLNVDYTVVISEDAEGGTITYTDAPLDTENSYIGREMPITQSADIPSNNLFREVQIENALDKQIMIAQQLQEQIDRGLIVEDNDVVAAETDETKFSHKVPVYIGGVKYYVMLTQS